MPLCVHPQCTENTKFLVRASYLEIYNEEIRDLLGKDTKHKLEVKCLYEQCVRTNYHNNIFSYNEC